MKNSDLILRKAAVVIDSLDPQTADALLEQMDSAEANRVRNAVCSLGEVSSQEREQAMSEFLGRQPAVMDQPGSAPAEEDQGIEIEPSLADRLAEGDEPAATQSATSCERERPFGFLHETAGETIARCLRDENAQAVAVVLTHLPAEQAADVLDCLPPARQVEVIRRIADLEDASPEVIHDVEHELGTRLARRLQQTSQQSDRLSAVHRILCVADLAGRERLLNHLAKTDVALAAQLSAAVMPAVPPVHLPTTEPVVQTVSPPAPPAKRGQIRRNPDSKSTCRMAAEQDAGHCGHAAASQVSDETRVSRSAMGPSRRPRPTGKSSGLTFADLARLNDSALAAVFGRVDVDVAFLALTAAEEPFTRRVVKRFAPKQAKLLADRLAEPGPLLLSDVERAQEEVVRTAQRLIQSARAARSPSKGTLSAVN